MDDQYSLNLDTTGYQQSMQTAMGTTNQFQQALSSLTATSVVAARTVGLVTVPVRLLERGFGQFAQTAADAQSALANIRATSSVTGQSVTQLSRAADSLARSFPLGNAGAVQLVTQLQSLGVAGAGSEQHILALGKTMVQLAAATGSSAGQITQQMTGVSRAFGDTNLDPKRIGRFGDSLTALTAKFGGTAGGILEFTKQIAPFARQAGIGESATMGIAGAFSKLGDDGSSAGVAINKILGDINKSVRDGTPQINTYASIVGKTAEQFRALTKANPTEALSQVVDALGNGVQGQRALERLGLDSVRTQSALNALSQSGGLRSAIATSVGSYNSGDTQKASDAALKGFNNSMTELAATGQQLAVTLGGPVLGSLTTFADYLKKPTELLNALGNSSFFHGGMDVLAGISGALLAKRAIIGVGNTSSLLGLAADNSATRGFAAGRLLEKAGYANNVAPDSAEAMVAARSMANKRQLRALDAYDKNLELYTSGKAGPMGKLGALTAQYTMQRPGAVRQAMLERQDEMFARQSDLFDPMTAYKMEAEREARANKLQNAPAFSRTRMGLPIGVVQAARMVAQPLSQGMQLHGFLASQLNRMYLENDSTERANVDTPGTYGAFGKNQPRTLPALLNSLGRRDINYSGAIRGLYRNPEGDYAGPFKDLKAVFSDGKGLGDISAYGDRIKSLTRVITTEAQRLGQLPLTKAGRDIVGGYAMPVVTGFQATGKFLGRTAGALMSPFGGPAGAAFLGGSFIAEQLAATHSAGTQAFADRNQHFSTMSTTETIDAYRDSIGQATANTVTLGDQMNKVAKVLDAASVSISSSAKLTTDELNQASSSRTKIIRHYAGSSSQIAAEIGGLSIGGISAGEQGAIRVDLARQFSRDKANQIIAQTDWTGKSLTTGDAGSGTLSDKYIAQRNAQIDSSYRDQGGAIGSRGAWERIAFDPFKGTRDNNAALWGNNAHLTQKTKDVVDTLIQAQGQVYGTQSTQYGDPYATQQQGRNADKIIADAKRQHASADQIKYLEGSEATVLGFANKDTRGRYEFDPNSSMSFTDQLRQKDRKTYNRIYDKSQGIDLNGAGLTPLDQKSPISQALGLVGGGYGAMFDNTKPNKVSNAVNASLALPGDANLLDQAVNTVTTASLAAGHSLNDVADNAGKAATKLGGDLSDPAVAMQAAIREHALQIQSFGSPFRTSGQNIALSLQQHQADINAVGNDPETVKRRQAGIAGTAQDAADLRQLYVDRITQNQQYNIQLGRSNQDFQQSQKWQADDFHLQMFRGEQDFHTNLFRANRGYQIQVGRTEHDYNEQRYRQFRDFGISMARQAQDAAKAMYDPFHRIGVEAVWDGQSLIENLGEQKQAISRQIADLAQARKMGLSNTAIQQLGLADASHAQQLDVLVGDGQNQKGLISQLNAAVGGKDSAAKQLYNDSGNVTVQRAKEDFQKSLSDQAFDFKKSAKRTEQDFKISLGDQYFDYTKQVQRAEHDFTTANERENIQFQTSLTRMQEDLHNAQQVMTGDLAALQKLADKGLAATTKDFAKQFTDGLQSAQDALNKYAPGFIQQINQVLAGEAGMGTLGTQGAQSMTSGGPEATGGIAGGGTHSGSSAITGTSYDRRTGETTTTSSYVTPGTGSIQTNPRGTSDTGDSLGRNANFRPSTDFMNKNPFNPDFNRSIAKAMMASYGWGADEFAALDALWNGESSWNQYADNPGSAAYGIPQALPGSKMSSAGSDWRSNPATQIAWGLNYIKSSYTDPMHALQVWESNSPHWYAKGGIATKPHLGLVAEAGSPEAMIPLNSQGVAVLAQAMTKYMTTADHQMMTTGNARTHIVYDNSHHWNDFSTKVMGEVTVVSDDPNEMGRKLAAKQRANNLTATPTRRS